MIAPVTDKIARHVDNRVFFYLRVYVNDHFPELANATLTLRSKIDGKEFEWKKLLSKAGIVYVRPKHEHECYGRPLQIGGNELVGDQELFHWGGPKTVNFWIEVDVRLPDQRVLFAFAADVEMHV